MFRYLALSIAILLLALPVQAGETVGDYEIYFGYYLNCNDDKVAMMPEETTDFVFEKVPEGKGQLDLGFAVHVNALHEDPYTVQIVTRTSHPVELTGEFIPVEGTEAATSVYKTEVYQSKGRSQFIETCFDNEEVFGPEEMDIFINGKLLKTIKYTTSWKE